MLVAYALDARSAWWTLLFTLGCAASSAYGWMSGTWPFGVVEAIWAGVALARFFQRRRAVEGGTADAAARRQAGDPQNPGG